MAFQFQSVAALSPLMIDSFEVTLVDIGVLIGLYLAPGMVVTIPGGIMAARMGDTRFVSLSMMLMALGAALMIWGHGWEAMMAGRLLAGVGGVALNVVMTKMVLDWFSGREISTAMAIFINSWPIGITLALLTLPAIAESAGLNTAWSVVLISILACLIVYLILYHAPSGAEIGASQLEIVKFPGYALFLAGTIWALYNVALAMIFSFGPTFLSDRGLSTTMAGSMTSIFIAVGCIAIPIGGYLADRTGRRDTIIFASLASYAFVLPLVLILPLTMVPAIFLIVGFVGSLAAGPIVGLPSEILPARARALGMGVFYTIYYVCMMTAPGLAGKAADMVGNAGVAIVIGAIVILFVAGLFKK